MNAGPRLGIARNMHAHESAADIPPPTKQKETESGGQQINHIQAIRIEEEYGSDTIDTIKALEKGKLNTVTLENGLLPLLLRLIPAL
jgi:hypothetical protein